MSQPRGVFVCHGVEWDVSDSCFGCDAVREYREGLIRDFDRYRESFIVGDGDFGKVVVFTELQAIVSGRFNRAEWEAALRDRAKDRRERFK